MRLTIFAAVVLASASALAQERFAIAPPAAGEVEVHRDLAYRTAPRRALDLYRPAGDRTVPLLIFVNSTAGQYASAPIYIGWANAAAAQGLGAVLYQASDKPAGDFDAVMALLRQKAHELRIDPARVVVWSGSTNVQLGLPLAMDRTRDYIRGAAVFYGFGEVKEIRTDLPLLYVRSGLDSTFINNALDALVIRALAANAPWVVENYAGGLHGFEVLNDTEVSRQVIARTLAFAASVTRPEVSSAYAAAAADASLGAAFARNDWPVAAAGYRRKVTESPGDAEAHRRLGLALTGTKDYADALVALERAWQLGRRGPRDTAWPAAIAAARAGNVPRAMHWLDVLLSSPFGPPIAEIRGADDFAKVRGKELDELLAGLEDQQRLLSWFQKGRAADALRALSDSKLERYRNEAVLNALAYTLLRVGKSAEAAAVFRMNAERHPQSANAWDSLAEAAEGSGDRAEAVRASRRALELLSKDTVLTDAARSAILTAATERIRRLER